MNAKKIAVTAAAIAATAAGAWQLGTANHAPQVGHCISGSAATCGWHADGGTGNGALPSTPPDERPNA
ncbi:hypothetical protein F4553_000454 [Allocatelliglobosispora scoriae]|uniref:Uncharacterized protein n=1 Tax=Allocatelliglobosispora scoriae TaxID=643052 RepID=A0A841BHG7_9ACTN|nr:hypothetical protein [Allocatelliglobosispora scoriae]MBB5867075.1 hypothetical protein [Allocatelliglobosispora scoriae]